MYFRTNTTASTYITSRNTKLCERLGGKDTEQQREFDTLFNRLALSDFRSRFKLDDKDIQMINEKGIDVIRSHAVDFVQKRLAPAVIPNDGKQKERPLPTFPMMIYSILLISSIIALVNVLAFVLPSKCFISSFVNFVALDLTIYPVKDSFRIYKTILKFSGSSFVSFLLDYVLFIKLESASEI